MAYRDIKNSIDTAKQEGKNEKALKLNTKKCSLPQEKITALMNLT